MTINERLDRLEKVVKILLGCAIQRNRATLAEALELMEDEKRWRLGTTWVAPGKGASISTLADYANLFDEQAKSDERLTNLKIVYQEDCTDYDYRRVVEAIKQAREAGDADEEADENNYMAPEVRQAGFRRLTDPDFARATEPGESPKGGEGDGK